MVGETEDVYWERVKMYGGRCIVGEIEDVWWERLTMYGGRD